MYPCIEAIGFRLYHPRSLEVPGRSCWCRNDSTSVNYATSISHFQRSGEVEGQGEGTCQKFSSSQGQGKAEAEAYTQSETQVQGVSKGHRRSAKQPGCEEDDAMIVFRLNVIFLE